MAYRGTHHLNHLINEAVRRVVESEFHGDGPLTRYCKNFIVNELYEYEGERVSPSDGFFLTQVENRSHTVAYSTSGDRKLLDDWADEAFGVLEVIKAELGYDDLDLYGESYLECEEDSLYGDPYAKECPTSLYNMDPGSLATMMLIFRVDELFRKAAQSIGLDGNEDVELTPDLVEELCNAVENCR